MTSQVLLLAGVVLAAAALHWAIARAGRRLPLQLERRRGLAPAPGSRLRRGFALGALAAQGALWLGVLLLASERIALLMELRDSGLALLVASLRAPLFSLDERPYSALDVLALPVLLLAVWVGVGLLVRLARAWVLAALGAERGLQDSASVLLRYALAGLGFLVVLQGWGVDVRSLAIVLSVLGVGIGFGLQNIANNFVSGLLLNLGRAVRAGDYVHVGSFVGTVRRVGARSTEILTPDQVTILVPNSRFLENEVVNWSHGDPLSRIHVPVGVAYGSDVEAVRATLIEAAREHPGVLREPRPQVQLRRFGESSLDFELLVWTRDPCGQQRLVSELNFRLERALRRRGIQIPFPQRDLHLHAPVLERAAAAWGRRAAGDEIPVESTPDPGPARPEAPAVAAACAPEDWGDAELDAALARLAGPGGVEVRDRRHRLSLFRDCFVGREAVEWLVGHEGLGRAEAVALGRRLLARGRIQHVLGEHDFRDGHLFYRFRREAGTAPVTGEEGSGIEAGHAAPRPAGPGA